MLIVRLWFVYVCVCVCRSSNASNKISLSSLASMSSHLPSSSSPGGGGARFLAEHSEERTRHSIRSIDSGLGESDDPTQVDKDSVPEVSMPLKLRHS